jgi:aerobic carbon-monoxide dehydrogenase small subunit
VNVSLTVNGRAVQVDVEPRLLLAELIRDQLGLTGTKVGCDSGQCGSCAVFLDGRSVKSCSVLAVQADDSQVTTIEGINPESGLDALQNALWEQHGVQCGFCTPGVVIALRDLMERNKTPDEAEIRSWLSGNLCRCTGYHSIVRAALSAANGNGRAKQ